LSSVLAAIRSAVDYAHTESHICRAWSHRESPDRRTACGFRGALDARYRSDPPGRQPTDLRLQKRRRSPPRCRQGRWGTATNRLLDALPASGSSRPNNRDLTRQVSGESDRHDSDLRSSETAAMIEQRRRDRDREGCRIAVAPQQSGNRPRSTGRPECPSRREQQPGIIPSVRSERKRVAAREIPQLRY